MTITITNRDLVDAFNSGAFQKIEELPVSALGAAQAMRLQKCIRKMERQIRDYDKIRTKLLEEHGAEPDEHTGQLSLEKAPKEKKDAFTKEVDDLLAEEFTIEVNPITVTPKMEEKMTMKELIRLWFLFEVEPSENTLTRDGKVKEAV
jgi:hypothetical protein